MNLEKVLDDKINDLLIKIDKQKLPKHIAIIMDGNGRWATKKGLPRKYGHKRGVSVLKGILKVSKKLGCKVLTVYAFSTENWTRPINEVDFLINLFSEVLRNEINEIHEESTKIKFIGDLSPFPRPINNSKLVTTGIYRFTRHPMYYSLIFISIGVFIIKLSIYYLFLTISLALIIKFKIALEEKYLMNKFKNYLLYKNEVKV